MKRWDCVTEGLIENKDADNFIEDIIKLAHKYNLTIAHEDIHGGFIIEDFSAENIKWLSDASMEIKRRENEIY